MYTWLERFIINATPAWRVLIAAFCATPFFILILGIDAIALGNPQISDGHHGQAIAVNMVITAVCTLVNVGLILHLWPKRAQPEAQPASTLAVIESIGMGFSSLAIIIGQVTTSVMVILLGVLAVGLWLFERKPMVIGYVSVVVVLVGHDLGAVLGWWPYAPAVSPASYVPGTPAYWWFAISSELIFIFGWLTIVTLLWILIGSIESVTEQLARLSNTDGLTGLANRRSFMETLDMELDRQLRTNHPLSVVLIDADHFKRINDQHGHAFGDQVLTGLADTLRQCVRCPTDQIARLGGEEFALVLPDTTVQQAVAVCTRVQNHLMTRTFESQGQKVRVTLSMGIAQTSPGDSIEGVLKAADEQLYRAKSTGRDRVCKPEAPAEAAS